MFDQLARFGALLATAVTGVGYLIGLVAVRGFSEELGVSASDLDLAFRDYLVMAAEWIAVGTALAGIVVVYVLFVEASLRGSFNVSIVRSRQWATGSMTVPIVGRGVWAAVEEVENLLAGVAIGLLLASPLIVGFVSANRSVPAGQGSELDLAEVDSRGRTRGWYRTMVVAVLVVGVILGPLYGRGIGLGWAKALLAEAGAEEQDAEQLPGVEWLRDLAISIQPGLIEIGDEQLCAIRVQDRVLITKPPAESDATEVMVVSSWDRFTANGC